MTDQTTTWAELKPGQRVRITRTYEGVVQPNETAPGKILVLNDVYGYYVLPSDYPDYPAVLFADDKIEILEEPTDPAATTYLIDGVQIAGDNYPAKLA